MDRRNFLQSLLGGLFASLFPGLRAPLPKSTPVPVYFFHVFAEDVSFSSITVPFRELPFVEYVQWTASGPLVDEGAENVFDEHLEI